MRFFFSLAAFLLLFSSFFLLADSAYSWVFPSLQNIRSTREERHHHFSLNTYYSVYQNDTGSNNFFVRKGLDNKSIAYGFFNDTIPQNGWSQLFITTNPGYSDEIQMFGAGFLEGALTKERIYQTKLNFFASTFGNQSVPEALVQFVDKNEKWTRQQAELNIRGNSNQTTKLYWQNIALSIAQMDGLIAGYRQYCDKEQDLTAMEMMLINLSGDLTVLLPALAPELVVPNLSRRNWQDMDMKEAFAYTTLRSKCSALIKLVPDYSEIFMAHSTWGSYSTMLRVFKIFKLNLSSARSSGIMFSSYFSMVVSDDDFYATLDTNLTIVETTNDIINTSLYDGITPEQSIMYWLRVSAANRLATSGKQWIDIFSLYSQALYPNQWMITDLKLFIPGKAPLEKNLLWIFEEIPGYYSKSLDATDILQLSGFWSSFNRPYDPEIFDIAGYKLYAQKYGPIFSYELNPRAEIFRRNQASVLDLGSMKYIMNYNDYIKDPLSQGYAGSSIMARFDLGGGPDGGETGWFLQGPHGGIDSKVTSYSSFMNGVQVHAISGPTHQSLPPFQFSGAYANVPHHGMPELFDFDWITIQFNN